MTTLADQTRITIIKTPQSLLYRQEILSKDEMSLDVTDLNQLLLNSLLLGIAPDVLLLGIQTTFLSLEKKPLELSVVISAETLIIPPSTIVVDDSNDAINLHHQVILTPLLQHEGPLMNQSQNNRTRPRQIYLVNHRFILALLSADRRGLQLRQEEDVDLQLEEDLYDLESLKEAVANDAHQMKKYFCSTVTQNITMTPR